MKRILFQAAIAAFLALIVSNPALSQEKDQAPFGLKWRASADEITALGVLLSPLEMGNFGISYAATKLPKVISDIETVVLSFGYTDQLWRVAAISQEFDSDRYGNAVMARYSELEASLGKVYAAREKNHRLSTHFYYGKPENFASALRENQAFWFSLYSSPSADIELSIDTSGAGDTYWRLIYANRAGKAVFDAGKSDVEMDAL